MNFDLITKLAKLANNNPNENEANAAARKVCKLLAEANFIFAKDATPPPNQQSEPRAQRQGNPFDTEDLYDILRNMGNRHYAYGFDYDGPRQGEWTGFGGSRPKSRPNPGPSDSEKRRRDENAEREYRQSEEYKRRERDANMKKEAEQAEKDRKRGFDFTKDKTLRMCSKCGITKLTAFFGEHFVCNDCMWR
ncbi:MAG TPA: hypothetical protein VE971_03855 [Candidatus Eisenbacteria bacterium]|nr:hypothetical protein [Candidatus Eisenbacteria bacterium]